MADHAHSTSPAVQEQLDRLWRLSPGADILGLERITALLARLGDPHLDLPPVFHVAGTNGKGSTCAFLRTAIEAAGYDVHVYTSPHLVRFNERIRIAGKLIDDDALSALLAEVLDVSEKIWPGGIGASFFEVTTACAFLAFARTPAAACIVEVGLGGRLDATNVVPNPVVTGIAALGIDHQSFLGHTLADIAWEKAGIAKAGVPLVTMDYPPAIAARIAIAAEAAGAQMLPRGTAWDSEIAGNTMRYQDAGFSVVTNLPALVGPHQPDNLGLAIAMLRHQGAVNVPEAALRAAADWARWPARMQRMSDGPLHARLASGSALWLDGGHNPSAAEPVAEALAAQAAGRPAHAVIGMLANKDAAGVIAALAPVLKSIVAVPVPGHDHHAPEHLAALARENGLTATTARDVGEALGKVAASSDPAAPPVVLVTGSLYLAGLALEANGELPN